MVKINLELPHRTRKTEMTKIKHRVKTTKMKALISVKRQSRHKG